MNPKTITVKVVDGKIIFPKRTDRQVYQTLYQKVHSLLTDDSGEVKTRTRPYNDPEALDTKMVRLYRKAEEYYTAAQQIEEYLRNGKRLEITYEVTDTNKPVER